MLAMSVFARLCGIRGVGSMRPRRASSRGALVTHVLLPVTVLLRGPDAAEVIGAAPLVGSPDDRTVVPSLGYVSGGH